MIKIIFAAMLLVVSTTSFARGKSPAIKDVAAIWPYQATAKEVEAKLGKPNKIDKGFGQMIWYYTSDGASLAIMWDVKDTRVMKYAFESPEGKEDLWDGKDAKRFVTGETTIYNVIDRLGTPNNMAVDRNTQQMQYVYKNNTVQLRFIDGKLKEYVVSYGKKP